MTLTIQSASDDDAACELYGLSRDELAERFEGVELLCRWFAYDESGIPVGVAHATDRADGRVFVTHRLRSDEAYVPLLTAALDAIDRPVNVTVNSALTDRMADVQALGLQHELSSLKYDVPFATALALLRTPRGPRRFDIASATEVDADLLFELDTELRGDVPGTDGWTGNRSWFNDEMSSPEFDPAGYRVAVDSESSELLGLCRMWRNPDGPALGLLGVRRERRTGFVALELLRETLAGSREWGWPTFSVHTARPGLQKHLHQVDARQSGGFIRFLRP